jgi:nucleotide-binding universal stress UspA family protein
MTVGEKSFTWAPRRLLVGYDGSEGAKDAVLLCQTLAPHAAHVTAVDVIPSPGAPSAAFHLLQGSEYEPPEDFFEPVTSRLTADHVDTVTYIGSSPARVLEDFTHEESIDMIVVGWPSHGKVGRILGGSVAQTLLHGAPVPVATAPHGYAARTVGRLATIAVAYDGGEESAAALAYAQGLALPPHAALEVLTVERPTDPVRGAIAYTMSLPEDVDDIQRRARREVDPAVDLRLRTLHGDTADAIAGSCKDVDLLVVGSRGYGTVARVLLGSTSAALISKAPCPVIVVPRP